MARPREFDDDAALDAATNQFWRCGYAATSIRDLGDAMGLGVASLYNAFGSKHVLFKRCLDRYLDGHMRARILHLEATLPPRAAIEEFLHDVVDRSSYDRHGCLLMNTALELAPHDRGIGRVVAQRLAELENFFRRALQAGQADGSIQASLDAEEAAPLFLTTVIGLRVLARARPDRNLMEAAVRQALARLDPPTAATRRHDA